MSTEHFTWKPETVLKADFKKSFEATAYAGIAAAIALDSGPIIIHAPDASQLAYAFRNITGHEIDTSKLYEASLVNTAYLTFAPQPVEHDAVALSAEVFAQPLDDDEL